MELRSARQKRLSEEYKELKYTLTGMGLYEKGMTQEEMRQILAALQESAADTRCFLESDMEQAMRESELDFAPTQDDLFHSTMLPNQTKPDVLATSLSTSKSIDCSSPFSSPEILSKKTTVHAEVHHQMNWSPASHFASLSSHANRSQRKRFCSSEDDHEDAIKMDVKRSHMGQSSSSPSSFESLTNTSPTELTSTVSSYDSGINITTSTSRGTDTWTRNILSSKSQYAVEGNINKINFIENIN